MNAIEQIRDYLYRVRGDGSCWEQPPDELFQALDALELMVATNDYPSTNDIERPLVMRGMGGLADRLASGGEYAVASAELLRHAVKMWREDIAQARRLIDEARETQIAKVWPE